MAISEAQRRYRSSVKGRAAKARYRRTDSGRDERSRYKQSLTGKRMNHHRFTGVDGEGWTDDANTHHYMTLTVGTKTLYTGNPLTTEDCLSFLTSFPVVSGLVYVSYFFDYDVTMILREITQSEPALARALFDSARAGKMVWWRGYGISYRPKKHFKVRKWSDDKTTRTIEIHDVQGFFQSSFLIALTKFNIGTPEQRGRIEAMKLLRGDFTPEMAGEIISYSEEECLLLAELVGKLRDMTALAGVNAYPYEGPGEMASRALARYYGKNKHNESLSAVPNAVHLMAQKAYYGGRFEITAHGSIPADVYEYDLKSAYPAAMTELPCLVHGSWRRGINSDLYVAHVQWNYPREKSGYGTAMPFPVRRKDGSIYYPSAGEGWYWSHEIANADPKHLWLGASWSFHSHCDCKPFSWVQGLYDQRQEMEWSNPGSGIAIKLMLNTLYGKLAQTRPVKGAYFNMVYASLITSSTRAKVYRIYNDNPGRVIMFATDAVFTLGPVEGLPISNNLGDWEIGNGGKPYSDMVVFQPGVYFDGMEAVFKTRGVPKKVFKDHAEALRNLALSFTSHVPVTLSAHLSMRLALARGTESALGNVGNWLTIEKKMSANPHKKRNPRIRRVNGIHWSGPITEYAETVPYSKEVSDAGNDHFRLASDELSDGIYEGEL